MYSFIKINFSSVCLFQIVIIYTHIRKSAPLKYIGCPTFLAQWANIAHTADRTRLMRRFHTYTHIHIYVCIIIHMYTNLTDVICTYFIEFFSPENALQQPNLKSTTDFLPFPFNWLGHAYASIWSYMYV